ncbi:hypothetical protein EYR41_003329 [Orbilia oligospora]|uniref:Uncharacterized protein n=1 Tax=Orbilia oligospora TaxID=2813651 RepID=A0A7C8NZG7_ORBOL|nr:hypothetical protein TWF751_003857 [Orbilia oligospora]TGJ71362.1 hypothetical protein EYR41_003329 [Orbilia oligospora]
MILEWKKGKKKNDLKIKGRALLLPLSIIVGHIIISPTKFQRKQSEDSAIIIVFLKKDRHTHVNRSNRDGSLYFLFTFNMSNDAVCIGFATKRSLLGAFSSKGGSFLKNEFAVRDRLRRLRREGLGRVIIGVFLRRDVADEQFLSSVRGFSPFKGFVN